MKVERKALYNSLRLNWIKDPTLGLESWQVEDYRLLPLEELFIRLGELGVVQDRNTYLAYAENFDTPEEMSQFVTEDEASTVFADRIYLIVFELWRRLLPQKQSLSIFCDELDYQIHLYDQGCADGEALQDGISYLEEILHENADGGDEPHEIFQWVTECCAHDIEGFLYDFIAGQIDEDNYSYALDLLEGYYDFIDETAWFDFLRVRLIALTDLDKANCLITNLMENSLEEENLELCLEILQFIVQNGRREIFIFSVKSLIPLIEYEEEFCELLDLCIEYYTLRDQDEQVLLIQDLANQRKKRNIQEVISLSDSDIKTFLRVIENPHYLPRNT